MYAHKQYCLLYLCLVENIKCPLLLVVGDQDYNDASAECAELVIGQTRVFIYYTGRLIEIELSFEENCIHKYKGLVKQAQLSIQTLCITFNTKMMSVAMR